MDSARALLAHDSHAHLLSAGYEVEAALESDLDTTTKPADAQRLGQILFKNVAGLLKACLDAGDLDTFSEVDREWSEILNEEDFYFEGPGFGGYAWSERTGGPPRTETIVLLRRRLALRFGLVMWAISRIAAQSDPAGESRWEQAAQLMASRYSSADEVFDAFEAAQDHDLGDSPFTWWFAEQMPGRGGMIPTRTELLRTALLLSARVIGPRPPEQLAPREWFSSQHDEIVELLGHLRESGARWARALALPQTGRSPTVGDDVEDWNMRLQALARLIEEGAEEQREQERRRIRASPLDPDRVKKLRDVALAGATKSRLLRDTFALAGAVSGLSAKPSDYEPPQGFLWARRSLLVQGSRVYGIDMVGRDLGRTVVRAESAQFQAALPEANPVEPAPDLVAQVRRLIAQMRDGGLDPSLMVTGLNHQLHRELGLKAFGRMPVTHQRIPGSHTRDFIGVIDDVPVLDLAGVPHDRFWILDIRRAMRFEEWPSSGQSGLQFEVTEFDEEAAREHLRAYPDRETDLTLEQQLLNLQDRVLITVTQCWRIRPGDPAAALVVAVPPALRRDR